MLPSPIDFALISLAVWRLARMIAREDGPCDVFRRWRLWVGAVQTAAGFWTAERNWAKLWICPLCLSLWLTPLFLLAYFLAPWLWWLTLGLAISGGSCILELLTERR